MIGWVVAGLVAWVTWVHRQHSRGLKALPTRHHTHWLHQTGELPTVSAKDHLKDRP